MVYFLLLVGPVPLGDQYDICVKFNPGFIPFRSCHNRPHTPFVQLVFLTSFPGFIVDYHNFDGCSYHHDDDVEGICYHKY